MLHSIPVFFSPLKVIMKGMHWPLTVVSSADDEMHGNKMALTLKIIKIIH